MHFALGVAKDQYWFIQKKSLDCMKKLKLTNLGVME